MVLAETSGGPAAIPPVEFTPPIAGFEAARLVLEVTRGQTRFRRRPVTNPRFLIGSGATCDLRLGGEAMPALHSLITVTGQEVHLEAIAATPQLIVNGAPIQDILLQDGDVIEIGEVELLARLSAGRAPAQVQTAAQSQESLETPEQDLEELSALELIERIEAEQRQIAELEAGQRTGLQALTQAALLRAREAQPAAPRAIPAPHFLKHRSPTTRVASALPDTELQEELEQFGQQLGRLSQTLQAAADGAQQRESHYVQAADSLLETQQRLAQQLEGVLEQVEALRQQHEMPSKPRAIA
ncbi:MAG: FHA domain-containing protein [Planctomycetales bacterium]